MPPLLLWLAGALLTLSFLEALHSSFQGRRLIRRLREARKRDAVEPADSCPQQGEVGRRADEQPAFQPAVALIVPCKGVDPGLDENVRAFLSQNYPDYRILFVTETPDDPAVPVIERMRTSYPAVSSALLVAGTASARGQKVHNLLHALDHLRDADRVVAFGDSDIRPGRRWLWHLVAPLANASVAVSTGFRWYLPTDHRSVSWIRSVWNAGIFGLFAADRAPFAWGGALALRRETLDELAVRDVWHGALSDDYAVSRAARSRGKRIRFEPRCLSFTHENCTLRELLKWSCRQIAITRVYDPALWRLGLAAETVNNLSFWGGIAIVGAGLATVSAAPPIVVAGTLVGAIYVLRCAKSRARARAVIDLFPEHRAHLERRLGAYTFLGPLTSLLTLLAFARTMLSTDIEWRGTKYRMRSPSTTEILWNESYGDGQGGRGPAP